MRLGVMILLLLSGVNAMAQRNKVTIPAIRVIDKPEIEWISYPKDTVNLVGTNLQTFSVKIKSRLTLGQLILNINGIISDRYESIDFAPAIAENQYEQIIERTVALRTGLNNISIIVINEENIKVESNRRVMVDPSQIALLRTDKDQSAPMIYISNPSNISKTDRVTIYADILRLSGTVIDESGIML
jgi:hypothetical protein